MGGSGLGHLGFMLRSKFGANVICTDAPKVFPLLQESVQKQEQILVEKCKKSGKPVPEGSIRAVELLWGQEGWDKLPAEDKKIDVLLCVECMYNEYANDDLVKTWELISRANPKVDIWSAFVNRPFSWEFFLKLDECTLFDQKMIDDIDFCGMDEVHALRCWYKAGWEEMGAETKAPVERRPLLLEEEAEESAELSKVEDSTGVVDGVEVEEEKSIWVILDEMIGIDPRKLRAIVQLSVLFLLGFGLIQVYMAAQAGNNAHLALHSGFIFCVLGLSVSVEFVLAEAARLTAEKKAESAAVEDKKEK